jgi:hypothetical protein
MPAGRYDIVVELGATFRRTFQYLDADENAIDLTGWSARMKVRAPDWQGDVVPGFDLSSDASPGGITIDAEAGEITVEVDADDTSAVEDDVCRGVYDIELDDGAGFVVRLIEGRVQFVPQVTY